MSTLLPVVLVVLVMASIAPVIAVSFHITSDVENERKVEHAASVVEGLERDVESLLDPVFARLAYIRQSVSEGDIDMSDPDDLRLLVHGVMTSSPQVTAVRIIQSDGRSTDWLQGAREPIDDRVKSWPKDAATVVEALPNEWAGDLPNLTFGDGRLAFEVGLESGVGTTGTLVVSLSGERIERAVNRAAEQSGVMPFIVFGRDRPFVLPSFADAGADQGDHRPASSRTDVADVAAHLWSDPQPLRELSNLPTVQGHWSKVGDRPYIYLYRNITGYGSQPLFAAVAVPTGHTPWYWWVTHVIALFSLVMMVLAPMAAWRLGRILNRPMADLDEALRSIEHFDFDRIFLPKLREGRVREWRRMGRRLESTAHALSRLQTYVPRALVRRLLTNPDRAGVPEWRDVAVMFLDMEGFTRFSREHTAGEVAAHLNDVFAIVGPIIETNGGVIDKYTGDGLLAFWDTDDDQSDHITRSVEAARSIVEDLGTFLNDRGGNVPRARIGLHAGPAIVGNVGFKGRVDYTLVGDTINTAQRTESALRGIYPERSVVVAATESVFAACPNHAGMRADVLVMENPVRAFLCSWSSFSRSETAGTERIRNSSVTPTAKDSIGRSAA